jgi:FixJ family two-component response regulator
MLSPPYEGGVREFPEENRRFNRNVYEEPWSTDLQPKTQRVFVVDDDASVRGSISRLLRSAGMDPVPFSSADECLHGVNEGDTGVCVVLDVRMRGTSGLELHRKLVDAGLRPAVIYVAADDSDDLRQEASKLGALGFFRKPVDGQALIDAIKLALCRKTRRDSDSCALQGARRPGDQSQ